MPAGGSCPSPGELQEHTPHLCSSSRPRSWPMAKGERGEEVPEGSLPVLPGGLQAEVLLLAPT